MSAPISGSIAPAGWPSNVDPAARKEEFCKAITLYMGNRRLDDALTREELGQLEGLQRVLALRNGLVANCVRHCRQNPGADVTLAVLTLITFMADNNDGICRLSVVRIAQVFGRSERTIYRCLKELEDGGLIGVVRNGQKGLANWYWPTVPAGLAEVGASIVWFVDALSDKPKARIFPATVDPTSLPKAPPDTNVRATPDTAVTPTPDTSVRGVTVPPDTTPTPTPDNCCQHISLTNISNKKATSAEVGAKAPSDQTLREILWTHGVAYLVKVYGRSRTEADIRAQLGKIVKEHTIGPVLSALDLTQREGAVDPLTYMRGILKSGAHGGKAVNAKAEAMRKLSMV